MNTIVAFPSSQAFAIRVRLYSRGTPLAHMPTKLMPSTAPAELIQDVRTSRSRQPALALPQSSRLQRSQVLQRKTVAKSAPTKRRGLLGAKRKHQ